MIQEQKTMEKSKFTKQEIIEIEELIKKKLSSSTSEQKTIRRKIRNIGFYWETYHPKSESPKIEYNIENFRKLIQNGNITIINDNDTK